MAELRKRILGKSADYPSVMSSKNVDPFCLELAQRFLNTEDITATAVSLAVTIQHAIEEWFAATEDESEGEGGA